VDKIQDMQWCPNSLHVLCTLSKRSTVQVWSVRDPQFSFKIEEGAAGVQKALWAPDGQNILIVADFQIRLTVWSLVDSACTVLRGPKFHDKGIAFSEDGALAVVLEVRTIRHVPG
jgi:WD40 repeat protein